MATRACIVVGWMGRAHGAMTALAASIAGGARIMWRVTRRALLMGRRRRSEYTLAGMTRAARCCTGPRKVVRHVTRLAAMIVEGRFGVARVTRCAAPLRLPLAAVDFMAIAARARSRDTARTVPC